MTADVKTSAVFVIIRRTASYRIVTEVITTELKKRAAILSLLDFFFLILVGSFLHFAFPLSGGNEVIAAFVPVNESIWEHLKLILFPAFFFAVIEYFVYGKDREGFIAVKGIAILIGMATILFGYYTYSGILGTHYLAADIALFFIASAFTSYLTYRLSISNCVTLSNELGLSLLLILSGLMILFFHFTFHPPMLELFRDPITEDFGITAMFYR